MNPKRSFPLVLALVFASRLPVLNAGLGLDSDAWRVWLAASRIARYHRYSASRWPGNPVHEIANALLHSIGLEAPFYANLASASMSVCGVLFLGLSARALNVRHWMLTAATLAATPIFFEQSVAGMDYVWAVAFASASLYAICKRRTLLAGLLLGLAAGCRLTTAALTIPYAILIFGYTPPGSRIARILRFAVPALCVSVLLFAPGFVRYGAAFFSHGDDPKPPLAIFAHRATGAVWGELGALAIALLVGRSVLSRLRAKGQPALNWELVAWLSAIGLYYLAFLRLPTEAAYLVITIPFVLLSLSALARSSREYVACCIAIAASSFLPQAKRHDFSWKPRILQNYAERAENEAKIDAMIAKSKTLTGPLVVACNDTWPRLAVHLFRAGDVRGEVYEEYQADHEADRSVWIDGRNGSQIRLVNNIRPSALRWYLEHHFALYYLSPGSVQSEVGWPHPVSGGRYDLKDFGASAFPDL